MLKDIYFSQSLYMFQLSYSSWMDEHDEYMPVIKINGEYVPFSEQIDHGKKPCLHQDDLVLIATLPESEIDIRIVNKYDFM